MRAYLCLFVVPMLVVGCNTPPVPPGKPIDISTALQQVLDGVCKFRKEQAAQKPDLSAEIDAITVELDLTIDGSKNPPVAVSPDIQFVPTVSYGGVVTSNTGSRLIVSVKNPGGTHVGECGGMH